MTLFDRPHRTARRADRAAGIALLLCGGLAIGNLPHDQLPAGWLLAWTLPAALFGSLRRRSHRPWLRTIAASLAQIVAFALALEYAGSLSRPAVLACTILPPLSFVIVRRRDSDAALGLFLSFCVLLVGVILGGANPLLLAAYGVAACLSLRLETHLAARAATLGHRPAASLRLPVQPVVMAGLAVALPCLFVAFAIDRTLAWVPSPVQSDDTPTASAPAQPRPAGAPRIRVHRRVLMASQPRLGPKRVQLIGHAVVPDAVLDAGQRVGHRAPKPTGQVTPVPAMLQ